MLKVFDSGQKRSEVRKNNVTKTTWEFTQQDLNFLLFGYFTSKDEYVGVGQDLQGNICLDNLSVSFKFDFVYLVRAVFEGLLQF